MASFPRDRMEQGVERGRRQIPARGSDKPAPARRPPGRAPELGEGLGGEDPDRDTPPARAGRDPERQAGSGQRGAESRGAAECAFVRAVLELVLAGPADRAPASAPGPAWCIPGEAGVLLGGVHRLSQVCVAPLRAGEIEDPFNKDWTLPGALPAPMAVTPKSCSSSWPSIVMQWTHRPSEKWLG